MEITGELYCFQRHFRGNIFLGWTGEGKGGEGRSVKMDFASKHMNAALEKRKKTSIQ